MYLILESLQGPDILVYIKSRTNCKVRCGQWASYGLQIYRTDLHCLCMYVYDWLCVKLA